MVRAIVAIIGGIIVALIISTFVLPPSFREAVVGIAPLITALIALGAATIALTAMNVQRDTAKRRAAIDFFPKTEMDNKIIDAYDHFEALVSKIPQIIQRKPLAKGDNPFETELAPPSETALFVKSNQVPPTSEGSRF